jgi:hypothetical protein
VADIAVKLFRKEKELGEIKEKLSAFHDSISYDVATEERLQQQYDSIKSMVHLHERAKLDFKRIGE